MTCNIRSECFISYRRCCALLKLVFMPADLGWYFSTKQQQLALDNLFIGVGGLRTLDLSSNPLRVNFKAMCHYIRRLHTLKLSGVEVDVLPTFQLPQLVSLDVSDNRLSDIPQTSVEGMPKLRHLNLSRNKFLRLPGLSFQPRVTLYLFSFSI